MTQYNDSPCFKCRTYRVEKGKALCYTCVMDFLNAPKQLQRIFPDVRIVPKDRQPWKQISSPTNPSLTTELRGRALTYDAIGATELARQDRDQANLSSAPRNRLPVTQIQENATAPMLYVDHARIPYRKMLMSHLIAETPEELRRAASALGLTDHIQHPGTPKEHLDVSETFRTKAIRLGAIPVTSKQLVTIIRRKRETPKPQRDSDPATP